jgi:hypothetical protein
MRRPARPQRVQITGTSRPIAETFTDHYVADTECADQHVCGESLRTHSAQGGVKIQHDKFVDTQSLKRCGLVGHSHEAPRRRRRIKDLARMRLEGHHGHGLAWLRSRMGHCHERLMPPVHPIEIANCGHSLSGRKATGVVSTQYPHSGHHSIPINHGIIRVEGQKA